MKKEIYVGTRIFFFTFVNLIKLPLYISLSMTNLESFKQSATLFPVALLGILIGYQLLKIIEEKFLLRMLLKNIIGTEKNNDRNCQRELFKINPKRDV